MYRIRPGLDSGKGKFTEGEAGIAAELQFYLGGKLDRINIPNGNADFTFVSGAYRGKTFDFMFTPNNLDRAAKTNQFFAKNLARNEAQLNAHLDKADFVPMDFRFLTEANRNLFMGVIQRQSQDRQSKILFFGDEMAGFICISGDKGVSIGTPGFLYIVEKTRLFFDLKQDAVKCEIYASFDEEGMTLIALDTQGKEGFNVFYEATNAAYKQAVAQDMVNAPIKVWEELLDALKLDARWNCP